MFVSKGCEYILVGFSVARSLGVVAAGYGDLCLRFRYQVLRQQRRPTNLDAYAESFELNVWSLFVVALGREGTFWSRVERILKIGIIDVDHRGRGRELRSKIF